MSTQDSKTSYNKKLHKIGLYTLTGKQLGKGNFARVEEAQHTMLNEKVAVKIIDTSKIKDEVYVTKNLKREASILQTFSHPGIIYLYETFHHGSLYYLVTELVLGGDLHAYIRKQKGGRLEESRARHFAVQVISALDHMHVRGVVHRDLKMQNIMLTANMKQIKIVDLGLGNWYDPETLLRTNCGSPEYAAPELYQTGRGYGPQVDLWSLGVVIYVMVTGCLPFAVVDTSDMSSLEKRERLLDQIEKGFQHQHKTALCHMSQDCIHVVSRLLTVNDQERIVMEELMFHPWVTCRQTRILKDCKYKKLAKDDFYRIIHKMVKLLDTTQEDVLDTIKCEPTGAVGGIFNILLLKQYEKNLLENITPPTSSRKTGMQPVASSNALGKRSLPRTSSGYGQMDGTRSWSARASVQSKPRSVFHCKRAQSKLKPCQQEDGKRRVKTSIPSALNKSRVTYSNTYEGSTSSSSFDSVTNSSTSSWCEQMKEMAFHRINPKQYSSEKLRSRTGCCANMSTKRYLPIAGCTKENSFHLSRSSNSIDKRPSSYFSAHLTQKPRAKTSISKTPERQTVRIKGHKEVLPHVASVPNHARLTLSHSYKRLPPIKCSPVTDNQHSRPRSGNYKARDKDTQTQVAPGDKHEKVSAWQPSRMCTSAKDTSPYSRDRSAEKPRRKTGICASLVTRIRSKSSSADRPIKSTQSARPSNHARRKPSTQSKWKHLSAMVKQMKMHLSTDHHEETISVEEATSLERKIQELASTYKSVTGCKSYDLEPRLKARDVTSQNNHQSSQCMRSHIPSSPCNGYRTKSKRPVPLDRGNLLRSPGRATPGDRQDDRLEHVRQLSSSGCKTTSSHALPSYAFDPTKPRPKSSFTTGLINQLNSRGVSGVRSRAIKTTRYTDTFPDHRSPTRCCPSSSRKAFVSTACDLYDIDVQTRAKAKPCAIVSKSKEFRRNDCKNLVSERQVTSAGHSRHTPELIPSKKQNGCDSLMAFQKCGQTPNSLEVTSEAKEVVYRKKSAPHVLKTTASRHIAHSNARHRTASPGNKHYSSLGYIEALAQVFTPSLVHKTSRSSKSARAVQRSSPNTLSPRYNCKSHNVVFKPSSSVAREKHEFDNRYYNITNVGPPSLDDVERTRPYSRTKNTRIGVANKIPCNASSYFPNPNPSKAAATRSLSSKARSGGASRQRASVRVAWAEPSSPDRPHLVGLSRVYKAHDPGPP